MHRALLIMTMLLPSLAFACGGGSGMGDSFIGSVMLLVLFGGPVIWLPLLALFGLGIAVIISVASQRPPRRVWR
ncbi:MAG: hypothetical protein AB1938_20290 [Myxococcota bacterium]